jgi:glycine/D-amino acid oxidase-like deaminating enzyme
MIGKVYDLLIIGGGFAGTAMAYSAARRGINVLLLEAGSLCSGSSAACCGRAQIIESESADLDLVLAGFSKLEDLESELEIDLEWELPGHITLLSSQDQWQQYEKLTGRLNQHGVEAEMLDLPNLHAAEPNLQIEGLIGAAYSKEGHLNPFKFCLGFAQAAKRLGAILLPYTRVTGFEHDNNRITSVQTENSQFSANTILLAAGAWTGKLAKMAGSSLPVCFNHAEAMVSEPLQPRINHHIGMSGFYEAVHGNERMVSLGVGQHRNGSLVISNAIEQAYEISMSSSAWSMPALAKVLLDLCPFLKNTHIIRSWAAPSPFMPDYKPAVGWLPGCDNLYVAAGFHLSIPTIPLFAQIIVDNLLQKGDLNQNSILKSYSPARFQGSQN